MTNTATSIKNIRLISGKSMPAIGMGTWKLTGEDALHAIPEALDVGYRMIDTSSDYGNFREINQAIRDSGISREDLFITTKVEETDDAYEAAKKYVQQLGLDYADLIIIHRPPKTGAGEELWRGLRKVRDEGIARDIGVSSYSMEQMQALQNDSKEWPAVNQIEWTPFGHSKEMLEFAKQNKITIMAYSPLVHGEDIDNTFIEELADKYRKAPSQIVLRWDVQHGVVPIPKASSREHLEENFNIFDFEISPEDMKKMDELNKHYSALGPSLTYI